MRFLSILGTKRRGSADAGKSLVGLVIVVVGGRRQYLY